MTSAMSNAILEYAKLAGQLDCKTNQQLNKNAAAGTSKGQIKPNNAAAAMNRRKREFASMDEPESNGAKPIENGFVADCKASGENKCESDEENDDGIIKEKKSHSEATKGERKASMAIKQYRVCSQVDGDIGKLSEQLDNLESDLKAKKSDQPLDEEDLENGGDCNGELDAGSENENDDEKLVNALSNGELANGLADEYPAKTKESIKDGAKKQTNFNSFYNTNRLNDNRLTGKYRSKRSLIRSRSNEIGQQQSVGSLAGSLTGSLTGSLNNRSSSSNSPNDGSLNTTGLSTTTAGSSGNESFAFEDNLVDENRCSSATSINSNNGLTGEHLLLIWFFALIPLIARRSNYLSFCFLSVFFFLSFSLSASVTSSSLFRY